MVRLREERSTSRSGKHAIRELVVEVCNDVVREPKVRKRKSVRPIYSRGYAYEVEAESKCPLVHVRVIKCLRGRYKGSVTVIVDGKPMLKVKYLNGLVRRSCGDPEYYRYVEKVLASLRVPYRRVNLSTGAERCL